MRSNWGSNMRGSMVADKQVKYKLSTGIGSTKPGHQNDHINTFLMGCTVRIDDETCVCNTCII